MRLLWGSRTDTGGRQACLGGADREGRGHETVRNPTLDLSPMDFHVGQKALGGDKKVRTIGEDREEEGESEMVAVVGADPRTIGRQASNCSKGPLGEGESMGEVGRRGEVRDEPVPKPSELRRAMKELAIKSHRRRPAGRGGVPLHRGTPVYELSLGNREVNTPCVGNRPYTSKDTL